MTAAASIAAYASAWGTWTTNGTIERLVAAGMDRAQAVAEVAAVKASSVFAGTCADLTPEQERRIEARRAADARMYAMRAGR